MSQIEAVHIAETDQELEILTSHVSSDMFVMDVVCIDDEKHAKNNSISLLLFYFMSSKNYWCLPLDHNEGIILPNSLTKIKDAMKENTQLPILFSSLRPNASLDPRWLRSHFQ